MAQEPDLCKDESKFTDVVKEESPNVENKSEDNISEVNNVPSKKLTIKNEIISEDENSEWDETEAALLEPKIETYESEKDISSGTDEDNDTLCKVCRMSFESTEEVEYHLRKPALEKTFMCCACFKRFRDMSQLNIHTRKHTGEKPYECKVCGKKFSINGNLNKHLRTHTGERRFECDTCKRKFTQFAHLEDHIKTHSGIFNSYRRKYLLIKLCFFRGKTFSLQFV